MRPCNGPSPTRPAAVRSAAGSSTPPARGRSTSSAWGTGCRPSAVLEQAVLRDASPAGRADAARQLRHIAAQAAGTDVEIATLGLLAKALIGSDPAEAESLHAPGGDPGGRRSPLPTGVGLRIFDLANLLHSQGRHREALDVIDQMAAHTRAAGLGPWTQLLVPEHTAPGLACARTARCRSWPRSAGWPSTWASCPTPRRQTRQSNPWNVRETLFHTALYAATDLGRLLRRWPVSLRCLPVR